MEVTLDLDTPVDKVSFEAWLYSIEDPFGTGTGVGGRSSGVGVVVPLTFLGPSSFAPTNPSHTNSNTNNGESAMGKGRGKHRVRGGDKGGTPRSRDRDRDSSNSDTGSESGADSSSFSINARESSYRTRDSGIGTRVAREQDTSVFYLGTKRPGSGVSPMDGGTGARGDTMNLLDDYHIDSNKDTYSHTNTHTTPIGTPVVYNNNNTSHNNNNHSIFDTLNALAG